MSIALENRVTELETTVQKLTRQVNELTSLLKPHIHEKRKPGRPPKDTQATAV